jgi:hypothetical protein
MKYRCYSSVLDDVSICKLETISVKAELDEAHAGIRRMKTSV